MLSQHLLKCGKKVWVAKKNPNQTNHAGGRRPTLCNKLGFYLRILKPVSIPFSKIQGFFSPKEGKSIFTTA